MPSQHDADLAETGIPDLLEQFGEDLTHYPLGVVATGVTVVGIFRELDAFEETSRGKEQVRRAEISVPTSVTVDVRDRWKRGSDIFRVQTTPKINAGMYKITLKLPEPEKRKSRLGR